MSEPNEDLKKVLGFYIGERDKLWGWVNDNLGILAERESDKPAPRPLYWYENRKVVTGEAKSVPVTVQMSAVTKPINPPMKAGDKIRFGNIPFTLKQRFKNKAMVYRLKGKKFKPYFVVTNASYEAYSYTFVIKPLNF